MPITRRVVKKYQATVKEYNDGTIKIEPVVKPDEWLTYNQQMQEEKDKRVPRAKDFLKALHLDVPGTKVPKDLVQKAADLHIYRGPLMDAARDMALLHVVEFLNEPTVEGEES